MRLTNLWSGVRAALAAPRWVSSPRLTELFILPPDASAVPYEEPYGALRVARRALALLARVPGRRWRATCLYESVAECLVLRARGVPAAVCIGVKRTDGDGAGIAAHAWVARTESDRRFHGFSTMDVLDELKAQR
jgi:hypothetical protein